MNINQYLNKRDRIIVIFILFVVASWAMGATMSLIDDSFEGGGGGLIDPGWAAIITSIIIFSVTGLLIFSKRDTSFWIPLVFLGLWFGGTIFVVVFQINLILVGVIAVGALLFAWLTKTNFGKRAKFYIGGTIAFGLGLILYYLFFGAGDIISEESSGETGSSLLPELFGGGGTGAEGGFRGSGLLIIVLIAIFVLLLFVMRRYELISAGSEESDEKELEEDLSSTVDQAIKDISQGKDVNSTIQRCYFQMCLLLEEEGAKNEDYMTPREFEKYALTQLSVSQSNISKIRDLFEKVKYGSHEFDEEQRKIAMKHLKNLRSELGDT